MHINGADQKLLLRLPRALHGLQKLFTLDHPPGGRPCLLWLSSQVQFTGGEREQEAERRADSTCEQGW